jgi:Fe-S-cluster containining protein
VIASPGSLKLLYPRFSEVHKEFKKQLRKFPSSQIDPVVFALNQKYTGLIDCKSCANCCKTLEPGMTGIEADTLVQLSNDPNSFANNYISREPSGICYLKAKPCFFLQENLCKIYSQRPQSCADYPHLTKSNFKYQRSVWESVSLCPIVFNVVEELRTTLLENPLQP